MEFRVANPQDLPLIRELADQIFRAHRPGQHMADEFPYLYDHANAHHWYIAVQESAVVSMIGAMVWPATIAGAKTSVASMGSVATDPQWRRKGLSSHLLKLAQDCLVKERVRVALISGDLPLYWRFGARPIGRVRWYALDPSSSFAGKPSWFVRNIDDQADALIVARLYQSRATRFSRTLPQLEAMLKAQPLTQVEKGQKTALLVFDGPQPLAYLIVNDRPFNGQEPSRLLEWAGDPRAVLYGISGLEEGSRAGMRIPVLPEDLGLEGALKALKPVSQGPVSWLAKVMDGEGLAHDLWGLWHESGSILPQISEIAPDQYRLVVGDDTWAIDAAKLTEWIFQDTQSDRPRGLETIWPSPALWPEGLNYI